MLIFNCLLWDELIFITYILYKYERIKELNGSKVHLQGCSQEFLFVGTKVKLSYWFVIQKILKPWHTYIHTCLYAFFFFFNIKSKVSHNSYLILHDYCYQKIL